MIPLLLKLKAGQEEASLLSLDHDPDIFFSFLNNLENDGNRLTKRNVKLLMKFTVNLDQSLRQNIAYLRSVSEMDSSVETPVPVQPEPEAVTTVHHHHAPMVRSDTDELMYNPYAYKFYNNLRPPQGDAVDGKAAGDGKTPSPPHVPRQLSVLKPPSSMK